MGVSRIGLIWGRYGNKIMIEVNKYINELLVVYYIIVIGVDVLNKFIK